ncbi:HNH endonuclease [Candidatus Magnetomonas plexicatena]|uniref:HNH endonuclease n=1 Tax=Candidatus Magnetomonas plexicatena TaxID=2552947 RepID=UPI001C78ED1F|nr:HNH endonuclease [Nitrospirales bacterium LBB_01]
MPFNEALKIKIRKKAHLACCLCKSMGVEVHHIIPQEEGGADTEDNAAPLCPSCHETYGANSQKRKFIREARDLWYEICEKRFAADPHRLDDMQRLLENIESHVQSSNYPLLPFALFYTLRHTTTPATIERTFQNVQGYKSLKSDILKLVGTVQLGGHGFYNPIELSPNESHCKLDKKAIASLIENHSGFGESVIKGPMETTIEFFFTNAKSEPDKPSLVLEKAFEDKPRNVGSLELFDDVIFQDVFATGWEVTNPSKRAWSINHLQGAKVCLQMKFMSFDDINLRRSPRFHNLHMYFGKSTPHILFLKAAQFIHLNVMEDPHPVAKWNFSNIGMTAREMLMRYEFQIDDELFFNQLSQIV